MTDGQSIFKICRRDGEVMDALKEGQMAFFVAIDDIATSVETNVRSFEEDRDRSSARSRGRGAHGDGLESVPPVGPKTCGATAPRAAARGSQRPRGVGGDVRARPVLRLPGA